MITVQEVVRRIEETGVTGDSFKISFVKTNGQIRQMTARKRNVMKQRNGQSKEGSSFNYHLRKKHKLLVNEVSGPRELPKTIGISTILEFNGKKVYPG